MPNNTKERILLAALDLFSSRGYDGVSVRDIAQEVGIQQSALYKHFGGKQDIFDSLMENMGKRYEEMANEYRIPKGDISEIAKQYEDVGLEQFKYIGKTLFLFWMKDEFASKFRRMLTIEQFKNSHAGETYRSLLMKEPLEYQTNLFRMMIDHQYIRETDPQAMALQFYSPFFLLFGLYDNQQEKIEEALNFLEKHIELFVKQYIVFHISHKKGWKN